MATLLDFLKNARKTQIITVVAIFAALYIIFRRMDAIPMIGISNSTFSLSDGVAPLYGVILGPYIGGLSAIVGTFAAMALGKSMTFWGLDFLPATVNVIALGLLVQRKWKTVIVLNLALLLAFVLHPYTLNLVNANLGGLSFSFPFAWLHLIAFGTLLSPLSHKAIAWIKSLKTRKIAQGLAVLTFIGTMMQHLMGNLLWETIFGLFSDATKEALAIDFTIIFFIYPWERLFFVILAVLVGTPLIKILHSSFQQAKS